MLYVDLPDTPLRPSPQHQSLAVSHTNKVFRTLFESALAGSKDPPSLSTIRSLAYFQAVIADLQQQFLPDGPSTIFRLKFQAASKLCRKMFKKDVSDDR